jgi:hypothetical protein
VLLLLLVVVLLLWLRVPAVVVVVSAAATSGTASPAGAIAGWVAGSGLVHGGSGVLEHGRERSRVPTVSPLRRAWPRGFRFWTSEVDGSVGVRFRIPAIIHRLKLYLPVKRSHSCTHKNTSTNLSSLKSRVKNRLSSGSCGQDET